MANGDPGTDDTIELPPLRTVPGSERLELRPPDQRDIELIRDASSDPNITGITTVPATWSEDAGRAFIARQSDRPGEGRGWSFTIVDRETATPVGNLFVSRWLAALGVVELGYWIGPSHRGRGYAADTLTLARDWALEEFAVDRLTLFIDTENLASQRTAERAGFAPEDTHDRWQLRGSELRPMTSWRFGSGSPVPAVVGLAETRMWLDDYRGDRAWFDHHLHDAFVEFGCSGKLWTRAEIVDTALEGPIDGRLPLRNPHLSQLEKDTWLLTYESVQSYRRCRRSSIWQRTSQGWKLRFHQGTVLPVAVSGSSQAMVTR